MVCSMLDSQKHGFVPPPEYIHLQQGLLHTPVTPHLPGYSPYCHPASLHSGFFPATGGEERMRSATSPDGSTLDAQGSSSGTAASPPTPPVTPGNRHQLPAQDQQQIGSGHMTSSVSPPGIRWKCVIFFTINAGETKKMKKWLKDRSGHLYTPAYREIRTAVVYKLKWRTDQH